jgi:hypothetical protein
MAATGFAGSTQLAGPSLSVTGNVRPGGMASRVEVACQLSIAWSDNGRPLPAPALLEAP